MADFVNAFLGIDVFNTAGNYIGMLIVFAFSFLAIEFLVQMILIFWRWLFRVK